MTDPIPRSDNVRRLDAKRRRMRQPPAGEPPSDAVVLDPKAPLPAAKAMVDAEFTREGVRTLHHWRDSWWVWRDGRWSQASDQDMRNATYTFLASCFLRNRRDEFEPYQPSPRSVYEVLDAAKSITALSKQVEPPAWLTTDPDQPPANEFLPVANGLLHVHRGELWRPTPKFFSLSTLPVAFDDTAAEPARWLRFLEEVWPTDPQSRDTLAEIIGYILMGETRYHKAFLLVGAGRSGKGTIARVIKGLLGAENIAGPTIDSLGQLFGLEQLYGKRLAIVADARLSQRTDLQALSERILSITGDDTLSVPRKHREAWVGRLGTRFLITTNVMPHLNDVSGVLVRRFILLHMAESFEGREDIRLDEKLTVELPGILNWALKGWKRLSARGRFEQPASAAAQLSLLQDLASPVLAFVRDRCRIERGLAVSRDAIFENFKEWCRDMDIDSRRVSKVVFGRDLRAAVPNLGEDRASTADVVGKRPRLYTGIGLNPSVHRL